MENVMILAIVSIPAGLDPELHGSGGIVNVFGSWVGEQIVLPEVDPGTDDARFIANAIRSARCLPGLTGWISLESELEQCHRRGRLGAQSCLRGSSCRPRQRTGR